MKKRGEYYITQFFYLNLQTLIFIGKMKQLKFLMVALTLLMGISFTSCLNSDDGEYDDIYGMVLVNNYMGLLSFEDAAGKFKFEDFRFSNGNHLRKEHRT